VRFSVHGSHQPHRAAVCVVDQSKFARAWQFVMPPLAFDMPEAGAEHHAEQQRAVVLDVLGQAGMKVFGFGDHRVETGAHVEFVAVSIDQGEIDGRAATVIRAAIERRDKGRIGQEVPEHLLRLRRAIGIENLERHAEALRDFRGFSQGGFCGFEQEAVRGLVDRLAGEIAIGRVDEIDLDVMRFWRDVQQLE
jgi:hypothetical protein